MRVFVCDANGEAWESVTRLREVPEIAAKGKGIGLRAMPADLSDKVGHLAKAITPCGGQLP